ncbi:MBL fold metallo-hydrolase [Alteromonadales bacterium alter-6D02]|nr:MBL fold metallo-hydrolase [Alteromonadales bacterium alter-6D02]
MKLTFLGAADTVTGSKYLLQCNGLTILIDCGLYQGVKKLRSRNWQSFPIEVKKLDAVILTHAHIDHSGYLPALMKQGYEGPVYASKGTSQLCQILLPDAGYLQEEEANFANKHKYSRHHPAKPLYTEQHARQVLKQFKPMTQNQFHSIKSNREHNQLGCRFMFTPVGHILGACAVHIDDGHKRLVFSGDIGRYDDPIMHNPDAIEHADVMVVESTYGDRRHQQLDTQQALADIINETVNRGGTVLIPSFAVGRAQLLLYHIKQLLKEHRIPTIPVYLNSPMAISATDLYKKFNRQLKLSQQDCAEIDNITRYVRTQEESIRLNESTYPAIIISASGMASGGRVIHHMKNILPNHRNSLVFAGYQAAGTRGQAIVDGAKETKIHGQTFQVKAQVHNIGSLSAHGDYAEIIHWLGLIKQRPQQVYITHGESCAADCMRLKVERAFHCNVRVPELNETVTI